MISQLIWSIYLPNDYAFHYFDATLEKEEIIRGIKVFTGAQRRYNENVIQEIQREAGKHRGTIHKDQLQKMYHGNNYQSKFRNLPLREEQITTQLNAELEFSNRLNELSRQAIQPKKAGSGTRTAGMMPIQIEIPTGGQLYRFAKTIITRQDPLRINMAFTQNWVVGVACWTVILLLIFLCVLFRKRLNGIFVRFNGIMISLRRFYHQHDHRFHQAAKSPMTTFVLLGFVIAGCFISKFVALPIGVLFWISLAYQFFLYRKTAAKNRVSKNTAG
jgi:hypothetical protein